MRSLIALALVGSWLHGAPAHAFAYARSVVVTDRGVVSNRHVLASQASAQILAKRGSAIDAAITANAVPGATEPMMSGMGTALSAPRFTIRDTGEPNRMQGCGRESRVRPVVLAEIRNQGAISSCAKSTPPCWAGDKRFFTTQKPEEVSERLTRGNAAEPEAIPLA